jgi:hypothetical protein
LRSFGAYIRLYIGDMELLSLETNLENDLNNMRKYYESGKTKEASWRESQLKGLRNFVKENEEKILKSLKKDLGKHHVEAFRDEVCFIYYYIYLLYIEVIYYNIY